MEQKLEFIEEIISKNLIQNHINRRQFSYKFNENGLYWNIKTYYSELHDDCTTYINYCNYSGNETWNYLGKKYNSLEPELIQKACIIFDRKQNELLRSYKDDLVEIDGLIYFVTFYVDNSLPTYVLK